MQATPADFTPSIPNRGARIPELDGFRGLAVLLVVVLHYVVHHVAVAPGSMVAYAQRYLLFMWVGVDAFFVLSGFLIGGILIDHRDSRNLFPVFYARRALRIVPAYSLLLVAWIAARSLPHPPGMEWLLEPQLPTWSYVLFVQNFWMGAANTTAANFVAATWSLAVEEQFYFLFPLLIRFCSPRRIPVILFAGLLTAPSLRAILAIAAPGEPQWQLVMLPTRCDSLLAGVLVAWFVRQPQLLDRARRHVRHLRASLAVLAGAMACWPLLLYSGPPPGALSAFLCHLSVAAFFAGVLLALRLDLLGPAAVLLRSAPMRYFGRISYFLYLFHTAVLGLLFATFSHKAPVLQSISDWALMGIAFGTSVLLAEASWRWIEGPLLQWGHRLDFRGKDSRPVHAVQAEPAP